MARFRFPVPFLAGRTDTAEVGHVWRPEGVDAWIVHLTVAGHGRIGRGPAAVEARPGRLACFPPAVPHDYGAEGGTWSHLWAYFTPRPAWIDLLSWPEAGGGVRLLDLDEPAGRARVEALFTELVEVSRGTAPRRQQIAEALLELLLLWCDAANPQATGAMDPRLALACGRVAARLDEPWTVAAMAAVAGLSPSRFAHAFRAASGEPPLAWLLRRRLDRAAQDLLMGREAVGAVAAACGFTDPTWFARAFRRRFGCSPRAWRRQGGQR